ncbi:MAG: ASKHA domain-containing protein [Acetivibrionales bacterium]|jgi:uncharacterized 2Fe-2S/4Fe-4S cluster protein (DUF4445 family)
MEYSVRIHGKGEVIEKKVEAGTNLLKFLQSNSVILSTPCGGKGTCGKCRVKVDGLKEEAIGKEAKLLGENAVKKGYRLACYNNINSEVDIFLDEATEEANIVTAGKGRSVVLNPIVKKEYVEMAVPGIQDQLSDLERVMAVAGKNEDINSIGLIRKLPDIIRKHDFKVTLVSMLNKLISVESGNTTDKLYGIAVDIGTTTLAAYLYNLVTGQKLGVYSLLNPQRKFGADVLSRIEYTLESGASLNEMNKVIVDSINNEIISHFVSSYGVEADDIYACVFVGNTTMMHFLMNITAKNIAISPFITVTTRLHCFEADDIGIGINPHGRVIMVPSVSGYIGADTVAAVLSSGMYTDKRISLLIDIGTNGEIVLGNNERLFSCSTAAGPAFEGANIRNGVGGIKGAIDKVYLNNGVEFTTIGNQKAVGICGSGIVDAIAQMLTAGVIDETGRIVDEDEADGLPEDLKSRIINIENMKAFLLLKAEESAIDTDIAITQKDIRELQNAKAAIAAGIKTLIKKAGIGIDDIFKVYLAGGFGSHINISNAVKIGLIPSRLEEKVESIGNAAGQGAVEGLLSVEALQDTSMIKERIKYIELSASADFVDEYVSSMIFE